VPPSSTRITTLAGAPLSTFSTASEVTAITGEDTHLCTYVTASTP